MGNISQAALGAVLALVSASVLCAGPQETARYPSRPIRLIVALAPGGGTDIVARVMANHLSESLGQRVIVDNRPGGGGTIGAETTARSNPDGYTVLMASASYATNAAVYRQSFDPLKDVTPVASLATGPFIVVVHPSLPINSVKDLIAVARTKPGALNFGSTGNGGITHLALELFQLLSNVKLNHVSYKGTSPALVDLLGGQIQVSFGGTAATLPFIKTAKLRGLAVTGLKRVAAAPDLPTVDEAGVPGFETRLFYGLIGPSGMPRHITARLNQETNRVTRMPEMQERFAKEGLESEVGTPDQFTKLLTNDVNKWVGVAKRAGVKVE